jgi:hypothetical protein
VAELQLTAEERKKYILFRPTEYVEDDIADAIDSMLGSNTHCSWKYYNFILILMVLNLA